MKFKLVILALFLGALGGGSTTLLMNKFAKQEANDSDLLKVGPGIVENNENTNVNVTTDSSSLSAKQINLRGGAELRYAANKSVESVVHVKTQMAGQQYIANPLEYYFGASPKIYEAPGRQASGSGVIVSEDGYIITNNHVIADSRKIVVVLNDKREYEANIVGADPNTDIALLKIEASGLKPMQFANSDDVSLGEWVLAVGNPYNLTSTITAGIISAKSRSLTENGMKLESFLQTDAVVNPGNSGGALVNAEGRLIGINTAIQSPTGSYTGYSFAVPSNIARKVMEDIKLYGKVRTSYIGIRMRELSTELANQIGITENTGILVVSPEADGPAYLAGIKQGDIIKSINGKSTLTVPEFREQLVKYAPGEIIKIGVSRDGEMKYFDVTLKEAKTN